MNEPSVPEPDTYGPAGTYGCACRDRNARECMLIRYGSQRTGTHECCPCMCHQWESDHDD